MVNNMFADLVAKYQTPEMGKVILALFSFCKYCKTCSVKLKDEYKTLYKNQIEIPISSGQSVEFANTLYFQRRLVAQFYADMGELYNVRMLFCKSLRKKIDNWFTERELWLLRIILALDDPANSVVIDIDVPPLQDIE